MNRSYKKNWKIGLKNDIFFKKFSNRTFRRQFLLNKNNDEIVSGKNNNHKKYKVDYYSICDYKNIIFIKKDINKLNYLKNNYYKIWIK